MGSSTTKRGGVAKFFVHENAKRAIAKISRDVLDKYIGGKKTKTFKGGKPIYDYMLSSETTLGEEVSGTPWMYVKPLTDLDNQEAIDPLWKNRKGTLPCIGKTDTLKAKSKCGTFGAKEIKNKKNPEDPPTIIRGQILTWKKAWMFVFDVRQCKQTDGEFFHLVQKLCLPTFAYHCKGRGSTGVDPTYIHSQFETSSHMVLLLSDCTIPDDTIKHPKSASMTIPKSKRPRETPEPTSRGMQLRSRQIGGDADGDTDGEDCSYIVMGFMFLDTNMKGKHAPPDVLHQRQKKRGDTPADKKITVFNNPMAASNNMMYVDIICSRLGMGARMMNEMLKGRNSQWMDVVFGSRNIPYFVFLRAIASVYTYYPFVFGFQRTTDNRDFYPIFEVDIEKIRDSDLFIPNTNKHTANDVELMTKMFGPAFVNGNVVWRGSEAYTDVFYVYRITPECKALFMNPTNRLLNEYTKRVAYFGNQEIFKDDSDGDGYIYGKYIPVNS